MLRLHIQTNMSTFSTPLGMNAVNNPLIDSPFVDQHNIGSNYPPSNHYVMITEDNKLMITETLNKFMITE